MSIEWQRAEAAERAERPTEAAAPRALGGRTLLYIEDNLAYLRLVERTLERFDDVRLIAATPG